MSLTEKANLVYVFPKQKLFLASQAQRKTLLAGRAFGKTFLLLVCIAYFARYMHRAKFFLAGLTFAQLLNIVLVDMADAFRGMGWREYDEKTGLGHYVLFKAPPDHWPRPYKSPKSWDRTISFITGFCIQLLSFERPDSNRGGNYDGGLIDESALFKDEWVKTILMPMLMRANTQRFAGNWMHNSLYDFTSNPWHESGKWVFLTEELMKKDPKKYFFLEGNCDDNPMLHPDYKKTQEELLSPMQFRIEVLNERIAKLPNCYYPSFEFDKHCPSCKCP
ncbi:terminase large subunit domain-containing protein [Larkinella bovis]|uniref:Terminase large subunit domain-containing protein n=1 Tax=Larkinella bovis TaxID=683041 RepID=A0ABW0IID3_9BACT